MAEAQGCLVGIAFGLALWAVFALVLILVLKA